MKYVASKFNYTHEYNDKFCIYNSFRGHLAVVRNEETKRHMSSNDFSIEDELTIRLADDGFIVPFNCDEEAMADIKYFDLVANKELYLILMPTDGCNFRCNYCYQNEPDSDNNFLDNTMDSDVQERIILYVKNKIKEFFGLSIEWYGGEPLLKLDVINNLSEKLIPLCQERGKPYYATLTTNGYLLTPEVLRQCLKNHIYSFHVTVDGFDFIHDKFRVLENNKGTFNAIIQNLRNIRDNVKSRYFSIILRTNISSDLIPHLNEWINFVYDEFGNDKRFKIFMRPVENRGGGVIHNVIESIPFSIDDAYDILINSKYKLDYSYHYGFLFSSLCCAAKRNSYIINSEGIVKKCGEHLKNPLTEVGYLDNKGNMVLNRESLAKWVRIHNFKGIEKCESCKLRAACYNAHCPMKSKFHITDDDYCCGFDHVYIDKTIELLTSQDYDFILSY